MAPVAGLSAIHKSYRMADLTVPVLQGIDVEIRPACFTVLLAAAGVRAAGIESLAQQVDRSFLAELRRAWRGAG
ncbi:hypothetical protein MASR1M6_07780 [Rubrivivax sp.]|jgi:putative ABC transport system ATP-binding protein